MSRYLNIHEAYNARTKSIRDICNAFIVNDEFRELAGSNHSILVGPRGSGKTTLMKMLQVQALSAWESEEATYFNDNVNYHGVFIRTDRIWKMQYDKLQCLADGEKSNGFEKYIRSLFTYHVLEQIITTLNYIVSKERVSSEKQALSKREESELVLELVDIWKVSPKIPSLKSLAISISFKKNEIACYLNNVFYVGAEGSTCPAVVDGELLNVLGPSLAAINLYLKQDVKWALLFDELELAPNEIVQPLIDSMRGGDDSIILKLSLSPYHSGIGIGEDIYSTMRDQDVSVINLADTEREESRRKEFCKSLSENILLNHNVSGNIEGKFETPPKFNVVDVFNQYSSKSEGFSKYLSSIGIDIDKIPDYGESDKAPIVRRFKYIVYLLNTRTKDDGSLNSAKRADNYYGGFYNLCRQVEYNPRMLIGLMNSFVEDMSQGKAISLAKQISFLNRMVESYVSMLQTIPVKIISNTSNLFDFIDLIGNYFKKTMYAEKFKSEPVGSFVVDSSSEDIKTAIGHAWNSGALVLEGYEDSGGMLNSRFRLSYIFSHKFGLATVLGRECSLNDILINKKKINVDQIGLNFDES